MKSRIGGVPNEIKVYVLCELENKHTPEFLRNLFMNQAVEALNQLFTSDKVGTVMIYIYIYTYIYIYIYIYILYRIIYYKL